MDWNEKAREFEVFFVFLVDFVEVVEVAEVDDSIEFLDGGSLGLFGVGEFEELDKFLCSFDGLVIVLVFIEGEGKLMEVFQMFGTGLAGFGFGLLDLFL